MKKPEQPVNEQERLKALHSYELLDTLPEEAYDTITKLASYICDTPISLVTLLDADRNFLKSRLGIDMSESPRDISFCGHAILTEKPIFIVEDARVDERFQDNPLVKDFKAIFYAGVPLKTADGHALGTLCVYDHKPRILDEKQQEALLGLAKQVILLFEAHKQNIELQRSQEEAALRNDRLEDFARLIAHDLKSPLASIEGLVNLLSEDYAEDNDEDFTMFMGHLSTSAKSMRNYIDGLLEYYRADTLLAKRADITLETIVNEVKNIHKSGDIIISLANTINLKAVPVVAIEQVISNLIDNGVKYNTSEHPEITLSGDITKDFYSISVADNGVGIPQDMQATIFEPFKTMGTNDRNGNKGTGMGLATVKKLVEALGGVITVDSTVNKGSIFTFTIRR